MKRKSWVLSFALVAVVSCAHVVLSLAKAPWEIACGLRQSPGSSEFAAFEAHHQFAQSQQFGYEVVCEGNLTRYDIGADLHPLEPIVSKLAFQPVDLTTTPFSFFQFSVPSTNPYRV